MRDRLSDAFEFLTRLRIRRMMDMNQVLVAACVGVMTGWIGFGWVLAEAPVESGHGAKRVAVATQSLQLETETVRLGSVMEPNLRG